MIVLDVMYLLINITAKLRHVEVLEAITINGRSSL